MKNSEPITFSSLEEFYKHLEECDAEFGDHGPVNVHSRSRVMDTPLHWAIIGNHTRIAELLIAEGADIEAKGEDDYKPIHEAFCHKNPEMIKILLRYGADISCDPIGENIQWMLKDLPEPWDWIDHLHEWQSQNRLPKK